MSAQDICLVLAAIPLLWWGWWLLRGLGMALDKGHWPSVSIKVGGWLILPAFLIVVAGLVGIITALDIHVSVS